MKKIVFLILIFLLPSFIVCSEVKKNKMISDILTEKVISNNDANAYTAALLLAHLRISDKNSQSLIQHYNKENNITKKLFIANIFVKRVIGQYENDFIQLFPITENNHIISTSYDTEYTHIISPLYETLITLAYNNKEALHKLLASLKYVQGGYAEALYSAVDLIYKNKPNYIKKVGTEYKINLKKILDKCN